MSTPSNAPNLKPALAVDQSIYEVVASASQKCPLGTRLEIGDRTYYYAQASASFNGGQVVCATSPTASHQSGILTIAATSSGAAIVSATSSANVAADLYAEGWFGCALGTGQGQVYRIKNNDSGATAFAVKLYDRLAVTITSGAGFFLYPNQYRNVNTGSVALGVPVGVCPVEVTSGGCFWAQTWGFGAPSHSAATPAGAAISFATLGAVQAYSITGTLGSTGFAQIDYLTIIGKNGPLAATSSERNPTFLTIRQ